MISNRPYLIRALFEWLLDCDLTPHLLVDVMDYKVVVPTQYVKDGRIILNIDPGAVRDLHLGNERITFQARFGGVPTAISIPPAAVLGIYAQEDGRGMLFPNDQGDESDSSSDHKPDDPSTPPRARPSLKVVK
ncbi:Stringent starvation protein B [hydrothermal vent metagenome]|uniref:Stringent starvation protein B n=1 Tax=hydrothermal vent metagenome TaxID=652676 RepID=A0A3B1ALE4_9ZZZZ